MTLPTTTSDPSRHRRFPLLGIVLPTLILLWLALAVGCGSSSSVAQVGPSKPKIVTTTGMVRDMVSALVGEDANVESIMGPGVDPHLYQPSRGDSVKLLQADIVVYNGLHLEGRLGEVLEGREKSKGPTIAVGEMLTSDRLLDADAGLHDPHIWMDVSLWSEAAGKVADELASAMPDHADAIGRRASQLQDDLAALDVWGEETIGSIPESQRVLVTAHDAFQYFGKRYGVEVHGVQGVSTISDAAISDVNRLVDLIVSRKVPAVFFESSVSPRQVKAIVEGARQQGLEVSSDSTLLSDSMGADDTPEGTYVGMMQHNFRTIAEALGGSAAKSTQAAKSSATQVPRVSQGQSESSSKSSKS
ncbi:MAG: metal ABC transporter solute-binding protein, Zn/Mn family [Rubripirellula sp.]